MIRDMIRDFGEYQLAYKT